MKFFQPAFRLFILFSLSAFNAMAFDCLDSPQRINGLATHPQSMTEDFAYREALPPTEVPVQNWESCCGRFGPCPLSFPAVTPPADLNAALWLQKRVVLVAKKYLGLPYLHKHIPQAGGLDCSNFTAWVYNFGLGIRFSSNVVTQSETAGRKLAPLEARQTGDLLYFWDAKKTRIVHAALDLGDGTIIEARGREIRIVPFTQNRDAFAWARRILETP